LAWCGAISISCYEQTTRLCETLVQLHSHLQIGSIPVLLVDQIVFAGHSVGVGHE